MLAAVLIMTATGTVYAQSPSSGLDWFLNTINSIFFPKPTPVPVLKITPPSNPSYFNLNPQLNSPNSGNTSNNQGGQNPPLNKPSNSAIGNPAGKSNNSTGGNSTGTIQNQSSGQSNQSSSPSVNSPAGGNQATNSGGSGETSEISDAWWRESPMTQIRKAEEGEATEVNAVRFGQFQFTTTINAVSCGIICPGGEGLPVGAIPSLNNAIALLGGNQPVATQQYLALMGSKAGFVDQAYAQSSAGGFTILQPIQQLWIASRNVAYLITSLTLVVIGFMIMLRKKIDAQTVIGIEQALPNLVITLLLITFSYAIAGFVIDMIYFVTFFGIKLLAMGGIFSDTGSAAINTIKASNLFKILLSTIFNIPGAQGSTVTTAANAVAGLVGDLLGNTAGSLTGGAAGLLTQPVAFVIFAVAILFSIFKLFFSLLMSYIQIIIGAILGPLQLMLNAMPGSDAFSKWFRNLLANAMAFPAAALMLVFAAALTGQSGTAWKINPDIGFSSQSGVKWIPPLIYGEGGGVTSGNGVGAVIALFGIGILMLTPKVVDMVKEAIQAPEFKYGSAIGEAVGFGWGASKEGVMRGWGASRGYSEDLAAQEYSAISEFTKLHGRGPNAMQLSAIKARLAPQRGLWGPQGQIRGRLGKLLSGK